MQKSKYQNEQIILLKAVITLLLATSIIFAAVPANAQNSLQFTLPPNYYEYLQLQFPGTESLSFSVVSNVPVSVYIMTPQQLSQFSAGYSNSEFSASGTIVKGTFRGSGTYYLVIYNGISGVTAYVNVQYSFEAVNIIYTPGSPIATGIADYGILNRSGTLIPYEVIAKGVTGFAKIYSIRAYNSTPPAGSSPYGASLQLNINLQVNTTHGSYVYWLQDFVDFETNNNTAFFGDNIWNVTFYGANMSSVTGNGIITPYKMLYKTQKVYAAGTPEFSYSLPFTLLLFMNISSPSSNSVQVDFGYQINGSNPVIFDRPIINASGLESYALVVDGFEKTPGQTYYDAELVFAGEDNGEATNFTAMNATLNMWYTLFNGSVMEPRSVYTFGRDTMEAADDLHTVLINGMPTVTIGSENYSAVYSLSNLHPIALAGSQSLLSVHSLYSLYAPTMNFIVMLSPYLPYILIAVAAIVFAFMVDLLRWKPKKGIVYSSYIARSGAIITTRCTWDEHSRFTHNITIGGEHFKKGQLAFTPCTFSLRNNIFEIHMEGYVYYIRKKYVKVSKKKLTYEADNGKGLPIKVTEVIYTVKIKDVRKLSTKFPPPP